MESGHFFLKRSGTMNRLRIAALDRLRTADPTPYGGVASLVLRRSERRCEGFMGSFHDFKIAYRGHEPAGPVGRVSPLRAVCPLPSRGAHGVTRPTFRFMESLLALLRMHSGHEPLGRDAFHRVRFLRRKFRTRWNASLPFITVFGLFHPSHASVPIEDRTADRRGLDIWLRAFR